MSSKNLIAIVGVAASFATVASADFTDVSFISQGYAQSVTIVSPGYNGSIVAGQLFVSLANSTGGSGYLDGNHIAFCADVYQTVNAGPDPYEIVSVSALPSNAPMGAAAASGVVDLYAFAAGSQYGTDADLACAFQLAMWEVINDYGSLDINTGNFQATGMTGATAAYLNLLLAAVGTNGSASLLGLTNLDLQDMIIEVPAPGAIALFGLAGLVGRRKRRA
jgi:MYXO-CTERM domain-containing protein